jgi:hypothetical protein
VISSNLAMYQQAGTGEVPVAPWLIGFSTLAKLYQP